MKFVLGLLCVLVVIQGFEANSVKNKVERGLSDVWEAIQSAGRKVVEIYNDIGYYIPRQIEKLKRKAIEAERNIVYDTSLYKRRFESTFSKFEHITSKCYTDNLPKLTNLNNQAESKLQNCTTDLRKLRISSSLMMNNLTAQTRQTTQTIGEAVNYCFSQHSWWKTNPLFYCISERLDDTLTDLKNSVRESFSLVKTAVRVATVDLAKCVANAQEELNDEEKELIVSIKDCLGRKTTPEGYDKSYTVTESEERYNKGPVISSGMYSTPYLIARTSPRPKQRSHHPAGGYWISIGNSTNSTPIDHRRLPTWSPMGRP